MRSVIIAIVIFFASAVSSSAQSSREIAMRYGQTKSTAGSISVRFVDVVEDSRCPEGTNCVWAGVGRVRLRLKKAGKTETVELNTTEPNKPAVFAGHEFRLVSLTPYPRAGAEIQRPEYRVRVSVSKRPA